MSIDYVQRSLDEWYRRVNAIYLDRNFYRDVSSIFAHLIEVVGGLSLLASEKEKPGVTPQQFVPKALAWWMALCGKVGVKSVEEMVWLKFPYLCAYCHLKPHDNDPCREMKETSGVPNWAVLEQLARTNAGSRPRTLPNWQVMFHEIYPVAATEDYPVTFARFTEELGELAEAVRVFPLAPGYFLSEAADVFAWLMHLQNVIHTKQRRLASERGGELLKWFSDAYPDRCKDCGNPVCTCPPILLSTLGRIAHEVPPGRASFLEGGALLPVKEAMEIFRLGERTIRVGAEVYEVNAELIRSIHNVAIGLREHAVEQKTVSTGLMNALQGIEALTSAQRLTQESIDELTEAIAQLPSASRTVVVGFLTSLAGTAAHPMLKPLIQYIRQMTGV